MGKAIWGAKEVYLLVSQMPIGIQGMGLHTYVGLRGFSAVKKKKI